MFAEQHRERMPLGASKRYYYYYYTKIGILNKILIVLLLLNAGDRLIPSMFDTRVFMDRSPISKIGCSLRVRIRESVPTKYTPGYNSAIKPPAFHSRVFRAALGRYIARLYDSTA